jgi:hypothetical protein
MVSTAQVVAQDSDYISILQVIDEGDALSEKGNLARARAKYVEAYTALSKLKKENPTYKSKMVSFRLNDVAQKIAAAAEKPAVTNAPSASEYRYTSASASASFGTKPQLKLLDAGAEPRQVLRLKPSVGDKQSMAMTIKISTAIRAPGQNESVMDIPAMLMNMEATVTDVAANGDISYETVLTDASVTGDSEVMPQMAESIKASMAGLRGMSGTGTISDRGISRETELKVPAGADAQVQQTMDQMKEFIANASAPLPEEVVGPGARWEVLTKLDTQGMAVNQTAQYELVSIEGDRAELAMTITQRAAHQKIENASMPGLKLDLTKMTSDGKGTTTVNLSKLLPVAGSLEQRTEMDMAINLGQRKQTMSMSMDMQIGITAE